MAHSVEVFVRSDLYEAGRTEDGSSYLAELYMVVAEEADGTRWVHNHFFPGAEEEVSPDGFSYFGDVREEAEALAESLAAKVRESGEFDTTYWAVSTPAYGSDAYVRSVAGMSDRELAA